MSADFFTGAVFGVFLFIASIIAAVMVAAATKTLNERKV